METKTLATTNKANSRTARWKKRFLDALRESPHIALACAAAGIGRTAAYEARKSDPEFARQWQETLDAAIDDLEVKAWQLAMRDNAPLLQFLLKAHRRSVYGDKTQHEHLVAGKIVFMLPEKEDREP
jgi:hypothetical protein